MTWREAFKALANAMSHRIDNCVPTPGGPSDAVTLARLEGQRLAYDVLLQDLEYIAKLPPHRAAGEIRRLGELPIRSVAPDSSDPPGNPDW